MKKNKPKKYLSAEHINMCVFVQLKRALKMQNSTSICSVSVNKTQTKSRDEQNEEKAKAGQPGQIMFTGLRIRRA